MIIMHAKLHVNPVKEDAFLEEIQPLIASSREEEGNISYRLQKDTENENVYTMIEVWQDMQAVASHNSSDHFIKFTAKAQDFLAAPLEIEVFEGQKLKL
ncbi:putative quinol monooxygenase [Metabacillus fastidiosus]|uniref:putative quinol monooxygenase n=1 Tax=Metabacillus fastidiosus TaxID=1458 RepID=UPI000824266B|nr:putative quinol monooxygenase [Metabacillus fastidiosus]MED4462752.1 putative quinol monooxygenase [Metabacillus fastidiosus]